MTTEMDCLDTLRTIAHGRTDNGRSLAGETARQLARAVLNAHGLGWDEVSQAKAKP